MEAYRFYTDGKQLNALTHSVNPRFKAMALKSLFIRVHAWLNSSLLSNCVANHSPNLSPVKTIFQGLSTVLLLTLTACTPVVKTMVFHHPKAQKIFTPPQPDRTITGQGWTNSIGEGTNRITVLHVS